MEGSNLAKRRAAWPVPPTTTVVGQRRYHSAVTVAVVGPAVRASSARRSREGIALAMPAGRRIIICPIEATNNYGELTRFEVDAATTSLRDILERTHADPLLHCKTVRSARGC